MRNKNKINHWLKHPNQEISFIVGDEIIVFDTDSPEAIASLAQIEKAFDLTPNLVVKTTKGVHHYFRPAKGTFAKSDSHRSGKFPDRINGKTQC
ncbi:MAG: bifunctional DNA primase/polymerase [Gammaproteobacteria bacterium]